MARYIDADKSVGIGYLSDWYQNSIDDTKPPIWTDEHIEELTNDFIVIPKEAPTADVVEVKHGEWVYDGDCFHCSACNRTYQLGSLQTIYDVKRCWKYCANCGAKMDGGGRV